MNISKLQQLVKYRTKAAEIEREWAEQKRTLLALPKQVGYRSAKDLIVALTLVSGAESNHGPGHHALKSRKNRVTITTAIRQSVKKMVLAGNPSNQIARRLGISTGAVQNIKMQFGLVKKRASRKTAIV